MKNFKLIILHLALACLFVACKSPKTSYTDGSVYIESLKGQAYIQPVDKILALAFASTKTTIFFDFIDSNYCNVIINSAVGKITQSRTYTLNSSTLVLNNPITNKKTTFTIVVHSDSTVTLRNTQGKKLYNMIPCGTKESILLYSGNEFKKQAFLYPTLSIKEREYGAENQYTEAEGGRIISVRHPLRDKVMKINVYKLF
jgi:hypothetical protein